VDRVIHILKMTVALPMLFMFCIAAPVSTRPTPPEEPEEFSEKARNQVPSTAPLQFSSDRSGAGAAPPDYLITPGLRYTKATKIGLVDAVQEIHSRKLDEGFNFVTAMQELSDVLKKQTPVRTLTPHEVDVEAKRDLAIELRGELDPQAEEENLLKANQSTVSEEDGDDGDGRKRRTTLFPRF
jgi:hypothetical protein